MVAWRVLSFNAKSTNLSTIYTQIELGRRGANRGTTFNLEWHQFLILLFTIIYFDISFFELTLVYVGTLFANQLLPTNRISTGFSQYVTVQSVMR